jgi:fibronectin type III domain protein
MHSRIARCSALVSATVLLWNCDARQPLQPVADEALVASATNQKGPSGLTANALPGAISLGWQDNSPNEIGFQVLRSTTGASGTFTTITTTAAKVTSYTDTGLDPNQQYCYKVQAIGQQNRVIGVSNTMCANPLPLQPLAASNVKALFMSTNSVQITWTDNSINEDGFRVERAGSDAGPWTTLVTTTVGITSAQDGSGIPNQERVCYRVVAFNKYGDGPASNTTCTAFPAAPTNLAAKSVDGQTIDLTWSDNSAFEDGYEVQRCCQTGWIVIANLTANATSYRDAGLLINTQYYYVVRAKKDQGFSGYSNYANTITATTPPSAPSASAYPASSTTITVYWTDNSGLAETFRVERSLDRGASWMAFGSLVPGQTSLNDDGRTPEQQVCYRVYAANDRGESGPSNVACTAPPLGPTDLVATTVDYQSIGLTWTDNSAVEDGYWVLRYDCFDYYDCGYFIVGELPANTTSFLDTGLLSDTWYSYYVVAFKDGGTSDYSNEADAFTATLPAGTVSVARTGRLRVSASSRGLTPGAPTKRPLKSVKSRRAAITKKH